jgi:hypothetical protein
MTVEFRFAYNDNARLPEVVGDLVQRGVALIAMPASTSLRLFERYRMILDRLGF